MKDLIIKLKNESFFRNPEVVLDGKTGNCSISGESFMEDVDDFFAPIFKWFNEFQSDNQLYSITINIHLTYFNTSSSKALFDMMLILKKIKDTGKKIIVNWHCDADDFEMEDDIIDITIDSGLDINLLST
jgi:hypothetical protein